MMPRYQSYCFSGWTPPDHVQLGAAGAGRLAGPREHVLVVQRVRARVVGIATVRTEFAPVDADVCGVQVRVDVVVRHVAVAAANQVGQFADGVQIDVGPEQKLAVSRGEPLAEF